VDDADNGYEKVFLPYDLHPDRDEDWYASAPEVQVVEGSSAAGAVPPRRTRSVRALRPRLLRSRRPSHYRTLVRQPLYRCDFVDADDRSSWRGAARRGCGSGSCRRTSRTRTAPPDSSKCFEEPEPGHRYAIGADPATGRGADKSAAYVIDLTNQSFAVEFHGRLDEDLFAAQLHYLGRMYGRDVPADPKDPETMPGFAKLAVELGGGYGNAVIAALRDRTAGRPPYGNLWRNILDNRSDAAVAKPWGFPMNQQTRPKTLGQLDQAIRERTLPFVTDSLLHEMENFIEHDHGTTPRARAGSHDDPPGFPPTDEARSRRASPI
jgi:hypothetical protein